MWRNLAVCCWVAGWSFTLPIPTAPAWEGSRRHSEFARDGWRGSDPFRGHGADRSDPAHGWATFQCRSSDCFDKHPRGQWSHPLTPRGGGW